MLNLQHIKHDLHVDFSSYISSVFNKRKTTYEKRYGLGEIVSSYDYANFASNLSLGNSSVTSGRSIDPSWDEIDVERIESIKRLINIIKEFEILGIRTLSARQTRVARIMMLGISKRILDTRFFKHIQYLESIFGPDLIASITDSIASINARRDGKTEAAIVLTSAYLLTQPSGNVLCFNTTSRLAESFRDKVFALCQQYAHKVADTGKHISVVKKGKEQVSVINGYNSSNQPLHCWAYPGGAKKGTIGTLCQAHGFHQAYYSRIYLRHTYILTRSVRSMSSVF